MPDIESLLRGVDLEPSKHFDFLTFCKERNNTIPFCDPLLIDQNFAALRRMLGIEEPFRQGAVITISESEILDYLMNVEDAKRKDIYDASNTIEQFAETHYGTLPDIRDAMNSYTADELRSEASEERQKLQEKIDTSLYTDVVVQILDINNTRFVSTSVDIEDVYNRLHGVRLESDQIPEELIKYLRIYSPYAEGVDFFSDSFVVRFYK